MRKRRIKMSGSLPDLNNDLVNRTPKPDEVPLLHL